MVNELYYLFPIMFSPLRAPMWAQMAPVIGLAAECLVLRKSLHWKVRRALCVKTICARLPWNVYLSEELYRKRSVWWGRYTDRPSHRRVLWCEQTLWLLVIRRWTTGQDLPEGCGGRILRSIHQVTRVYLMEHKIWNKPVARRPRFLPHRWNHRHPSAHRHLNFTVHPTQLLWWWMEDGV